MKKINILLNVIAIWVVSTSGVLSDSSSNSVEIDNACKTCVSDYKGKTNLIKNMEKTLIILKPDCMEKNLAGTVIERFNKAGYRIVACKMMSLDSELLKVHYGHLADKPFFPEIEEFMSSAPVIVLIFEGENAIDGVRDLLGPTDSTVAPKGTIRGDLGETKMANIAHASDSPENAAAEIKRFFKDSEIFQPVS